MANNNDGHRLDSSGKVAVDFVWGPFPPQPNDERADGTPTATVTVGGDQNVGWTATSTVNSARLDFTKGNHVIIESEWAGYPDFIKAIGNFNVTGASGDGTTVTFTGTNNFQPGDSVNVTGLTTSAFNLSAATVATSSKEGFTVTSAAGSGISITGQRGRVSLATETGAGFYVAGVPYIEVPSVVGLTTALALDALKDAGYVAGNITTASGYTPSVTSVGLATNVATLLTAAAHGFAVGDVVTLAGLVDVATDHYSDLNGTQTLVTGTTGSTLVFNKTHADLPTNTTTALSSATAVVVAKSGTIHTQSVAAGAASIALGTTITVTPFA